MSASRRECLLFGLVAALLIARQAAAEPPSDVEKALDNPYRFFFKDVPLRDICTFLADMYEIKVEMVGIADPTIKMNFDGKGSKLRDGLDALLRPHKFGFKAERTRLVISPLRDNGQ